MPEMFVMMDPAPVSGLVRLTEICSVCELGVGPGWAIPGRSHLGRRACLGIVTRTGMATAIARPGWSVTPGQAGTALRTSSGPAAPVTGPDAEIYETMRDT